MTTKRFYEINSQILGLTTIQDKNKRYTFSPMKTEKNHMFLKALNELSTNCSQLKKECYGNLDGLETYKELYLDLSEKYSNLEADFNDLQKENEQLKSFKSEVFELIDKKINKVKNTDECSLIPRESIVILKKLKKELKE